MFVDEPHVKITQNTNFYTEFEFWQSVGLFFLSLCMNSCCYWYSQIYNLLRFNEKVCKSCSLVLHLEGNVTLKPIVHQSKELYKPWILIQIWPKSMEN